MPLENRMFATCIASVHENLTRVAFVNPQEYKLSEALNKVG